MAKKWHRGMKPGEAFAAVEAEAKAGGARNPGAVAYVAGVRAHGKEEMARRAAAGRKKWAKRMGQ